MGKAVVKKRLGRIRSWPVEPFELLAWSSALGAMVFLQFQGMRMDWRTFDYILSPLWRFFPKALLAGVLSQALYRWLTRSDVRGYLRGIVSWSWFGMWIRLWAASMIMTYGYFWIKVTVPLVNERLWDHLLWRFDVFFHLGFSPSVLAVELFDESSLLTAMDLLYGIWVTTVFYVMAFFLAARDELLRRGFMLSCVLLWTLGAWLYLAFPAVGPCYVFPDVWQGVREWLPSSQGAQATLWENYQRILAGKSGVLRSFNPTRGVAAMPSLHVAAHWLFALWARRSARPLFMPFAVATLLTLIGSVLTGWHYALDGYLGMLLAWLCFRLAIAFDRSPQAGVRNDERVAATTQTSSENGA